MNYSIWNLLQVHVFSILQFKILMFLVSRSVCSFLRSLLPTILLTNIQPSTHTVLAMLCTSVFLLCFFDHDDWNTVNSRCVNGKSLNLIPGLMWLHFTSHPSAINIISIVPCNDASEGSVRSQQHDWIVCQGS